MKTKAFYGLVGNGETAALVGADLSIAWLCIPRFDRIPILAGALDPVRGGRLWLGLKDERGRPLSLEPVEQAYVGRTAILRTAAAGGGWRLEATDYMPWGRRCLIREVRLVQVDPSAGPAQLDWGVEPVRSSAFPVTLRPSLERTVVLVPGGALVVRQAGNRLVIGYGESEAAASAALDEAAGLTVEAASAFWRDWLRPARQPAGPPSWQESYWRSLITLKLLTYDRTGAFLAAPTASFPAVPGGGDNWDYRYAWLRDGYYTAMAFDAAGLYEESGRFYDFAFSLQEPDGHWRQPLYTVDGADPTEFVVDDLQGPQGEKPIRFGNAAAGQLQLDNEGNVLHGLWFHYRQSGDRERLERHWEGVRRACEWTLANWRRMESGIWEIREYVAHWVHGKAMCHVALKAGALIAGALGHRAEEGRWLQAAAEIQAAVTADGWHADRQAYLAHYGSPVAPHTDISALALVHYGLLSPHDPRIVSTVRLMERPAPEGGLLLHGGFSRFDWAAVPFYLPTIWMARYYLMAGRVADCDRLLETCLDCATSLGLMAEHFDRRDHSQWGNFPQAFSHEEVARLILERGQGEVFSMW